MQSASLPDEQLEQNEHLSAKLSTMRGQMENLRGFLKGVGTWVSCAVAGYLAPSPLPLYRSIDGNKATMAHLLRVVYVLLRSH